MVGPYARHGCQPVVEVECILGIYAGHGLLLVHPYGRCLLVVHHAHGLSQIVVVEAQSGRQVVHLGEVGLKHQRRIHVLLVHVIRLVSVSGVEHVHRARCHEGYVGALVAVYDEGVLHVGFIPLRVEPYPEQFGAVVAAVACLSAVAVLFQCAYASVEYILFSCPEPSVLQVILLHFRLVVEAVAVVVVILKAVLVVHQHLRAQLLVYVQVGIGVGLYAALCVAEEVYLYALFVLGFLVVYVYLSCYGLVAVLHRRRTLRHLYALHPRAGHVAQRIGRRRTAEVGHVLGHHLHVGAGQSQQFYLPCARRGVVVAHVYGRVCGEALAKVAACRAEQLLAVQVESVYGSAHTCRSGAARHHSHLAQRAFAVYAVVMAYAVCGQ